MTNFSLSRGLAAGPTARRSSRPARLLGGVRRALDRWEAHRRLSSLPDYLLRDMGFTRDQIGDVVQGLLRR